MEKKTLELIAHLTFLAVVVWIVASALGKRSLLYSHPQAGPTRMDPQSNVWINSNVRGPNPGASGGVL